MEILSDKLIVTRKQHYCFACLKEFKPKTHMHSKTIVDGEIYTLYTCITCNELITKHPTKFSNDNYFEEACVNEVLCDLEYESNTPEDLLKFLNSKERE